MVRREESRLFVRYRRVRNLCQAKKLAELYGVSRQVIVQDIALIRTAGYDIISTNRGYILNTQKAISRVFKVQHTDEQTEEELYEIVDLGGCVENVMVNHRVYGHMEAPLGIHSRRKSGSIYRRHQKWKIKSTEKYYFKLSLPYSECGE